MAAWYYHTDPEKLVAAIEKKPKKKSRAETKSDGSKIKSKRLLTRY